MKLDPPMTERTEIVGYQLLCINEWCSGAENFAWFDNKLKDQHNLRCPVCKSPAYVRVVRGEKT